MKKIIYLIFILMLSVNYRACEKKSVNSANLSFL